jgi:hypothetical protein
MAHNHPTIPWSGILRFLWVAILAFSFYLLGAAMVHQHFNSGGLDYHQWRDSTTSAPATP